MPQYKQSDITNIYWATNDGFKVGRDPMGIQNSSISTYACLLPGLTNLTGHIRYYSIYCWLLSEYDKFEQENDIEIHQYNFIRRAELAMAFIMKGKGINSVVGANFISQNRYNLIEGGMYDLANGGDYHSKDKYWTFKSGAFGQYYLGSMIYFELIKLEQGRFYLRDKGKKLANAVCTSVAGNVRDLFLECIKDGSLAKKEIDDLKPLALNQLIVESDEWNLLNKLLTKQDNNGSTLRRETMLLMLQDIEEGVTLDKFVENRFLHYDKNHYTDASFGWYFYYLCEAFHYCIETIFCLILNEIDSLHNPPIGLFMDKISRDILTYMEEKTLYNSLDECRLDYIDDDIPEMLYWLKSSIRDGEYAQAVSRAIVVLLRLYNELERNKEDILNFEHKNYLTKQRGILSEGLHSYVSNHLNLSPTEYVTTIVKQVMDEHTIVAIGKMGNSNVDLRKFILEDGCLVLVEVRYPNETNPRIGSLFNFLQDMKYLTEDNELTDIAYQYIDSYGEE